MVTALPVAPTVQHILLHKKNSSQIVLDILKLPALGALRRLELTTHGLGWEAKVELSAMEVCEARAIQVVLTKWKLSEL